MEIKLTPSEYVRWFVGRRDRDLKSAAKGQRKTPPAQADAAKEKPREAEKDKPAAKSEDKPKAEEKPKAEDKPKQADPAKPEEKAKPSIRTRTPGQDAGPFVDKVLDKALEVLRAKLAEPAKAKAA
jgi:hypothetical protein